MREIRDEDSERLQEEKSEKRSQSRAHDVIKLLRKGRVQDLEDAPHRAIAPSPEGT
jgi:predicted CopG family antitoxin